MSNLQRQIGDINKFGAGDYHFYSWLDVSKVGQRQLIVKIEKYNITNVIDVRSYPVFRRPEFNSSQLMSYFKSSNVLYSSIAPLKMDRRNRLQFINLVKSSRILTSYHFFLFLYDSTDGASSEKKRITTYLDKADSLQHFLMAK